jgi:hypothetical protein
MPEESAISILQQGTRTGATSQIAAEQRLSASKISCPSPKHQSFADKIIQLFQMALSTFTVPTEHGQGASPGLHQTARSTQERDRVASVVCTQKSRPLCQIWKKSFL